MAGNGHEGALGAAYGAKSPQEIASLYDGWAQTYDAEMAKAGYRHPSICLALFARHMPRGAAPVLDAGAGTGLVGEWLGIIGYSVVEALDISPGMLAVAASKNIYTQLHEGALGQPLPFGDGQFAGPDTLEVEGRTLGADGDPGPSSLRQVLGHASTPLKHVLRDSLTRGPRLRP